MTLNFNARPSDNTPAQLRDRAKPEGWPVGSFESYAQAQAAVDMLADNNFPVDKLTIVGIDLMEVERVVGKLTWGRVLIGGAASGAWMGLFVAVVMGMVSGTWGAALMMGIPLGVVFGMGLAAVQYASTNGKRDFASSTHIVAGRYDVLCHPSAAREARDAIANYMRSAR